MLQVLGDVAPPRRSVCAAKPGRYDGFQSEPGTGVQQGPRLLHRGPQEQPTV